MIASLSAGFVDLVLQTNFLMRRQYVVSVGLLEIKLGTFKNEVRLSVKNLIKNKSKINGGSIDKKLQAYQRNKSSKDLCFDLRRTKHREDIPGDRSS